MERKKELEERVAFLEKSSQKDRMRLAAHGAQLEEHHNRLSGLESWRAGLASVEPDREPDDAGEEWPNPVEVTNAGTEVYEPTVKQYRKMLKVNGWWRDLVEFDESQYSKLEAERDSLKLRSDALASAVNTWRESFIDAGQISPDDQLLADAFCRYLRGEDE